MSSSEKSLAEFDGDLINHWYILSLENEVPADKPLKRWLYDVPYVLFRDSAAQVAVLKDKCLHRGAQLSLGTVDDGEIRCPYHGWKFNAQGVVTEIPSEGPDEETRRMVQKRNWCAGKIPTKVQDGCIWIWTGDPAKATEAPTWRFPDHGKSSTTQYFMVTDFDNEVTHLVQNFMDVPHTVFVHSKWFRNRSLLKVPVVVDVQSGRVKVTYNQPQDSIGFTERILNPSKDPMIHTDEYIFPNITRVDYKFGNKFFIINSQCSPISRFKTRVYTWIAYDVGMVSSLIKPFMSFYTRKVIQQDVDIMKNHGDNLKHWGEVETKSTPADELHLAIDKMRLTGVKDQAEAYSFSYIREREFWI